VAEGPANERRETFRLQCSVAVAAVDILRGSRRHLRGKPRRRISGLLGEDSQPVIHLLDTERVAPELVRVNPNARTLIQNLLGRERRRAVPGLRGFALRAGVAA
jgi:hypothetical protein